MTTSPVSIAALMKRSRAGLEPLLLQHGTFAEVQPSPDLAELLYWNVVVSFVVSVVANAAYDGLVYCLNSKGRVEPSDLAKFQAELNAPVMIPSLDEARAAENRIATLLETQYFYAPNDAKETAASAIQIIVSQADVNA